MKDIKTENYVRITKKTAREVYRAGHGNLLYLCPVNLSPENDMTYMIRASSGHGLIRGDFDAIAESFSAGECCTSEVGFYPAYYVPRSWWDEEHGCIVCGNTEPPLTATETILRDRKKEN